jgi:8-amino-7-oxononanoate synthase
MDHPAGTRRTAGELSWSVKLGASTAGFERLKATHPMFDAVIDEVDGRRIRVGDRWLADFASCNYLGLDLEPEVIEGVAPYLRAWGTHPSWSRMLGSPVLYEQIEHELTELCGAEDVLALPTLTHIHMSAIPVLATEGTILVDARAHRTIYDGCLIARSHGAKLIWYRHHDVDHLEELLRGAHHAPILICTDGINSMTGNAPPLAELARVAREHDALLYVDDAHGFGVIGERSPEEPSPYGVRGNGIIRHVGETYESIVFTAGLSKAYSSLMAFLAVPTSMKDALKVLGTPYLWSGPSPTASLATVLLGLKLNADRGDALRAALHRRTARVLDALRELNVFTPNRSGFPIVEVPLAEPDDIDDVGRFLFESGIYVTLAPHPGVPKDLVGFRIQITAANTDEQIDELIRVLGEVAQRYRLRPAATEGVLEIPEADQLIDLSSSSRDEDPTPIGTDPSAG